MMKLDDKQFRELTKKLDVVGRLLALNVVGEKKFIEQVRILSSAGLKPGEIADLLGKTPHKVSVQLDRLRKRASDTKAGEDSDQQGSNARAT